MPSDSLHQSSKARQWFPETKLVANVDTVTASLALTNACALNFANAVHPGLQLQVCNTTDVYHVLLASNEEGATCMGLAHKRLDGCFASFLELLSKAKVAFPCTAVRGSPNPLLYYYARIDRRKRTFADCCRSCTRPWWMPRKRLAETRPAKTARDM